MRFKAGIPGEIPEPVLLQVHGALAMDVPLTVLPLPLMSERMANVLEALGGQVKRYAVQLVDHYHRPLEDAGEFVLLQSLSAIDAVDLQSPHVELRDAPGSPFHGAVRARKPALVASAEGFPPYFHVKHLNRFGPFFDGRAHAALQAIGPRGFELVEVPVRDGVAS